MASSAKDIQLRELKDTITQLNKQLSEMSELIRSLSLIIEEKTEYEKIQQEQIDYLTKKLFGSSSKKAKDLISPVSSACLMRLKPSRIQRLLSFRRKRLLSKRIPGRKKPRMKSCSKASK